MIPFDLARKMILDIQAGKPVEVLADESGFSVETIENFFEDNIEYFIDNFQRAEGVALTTCSPVLQEVFTVQPNFDVLQIAINALNTYGIVDKEASITMGQVVEHPQLGIYINNRVMNVSAFLNVSNDMPEGILYIAVSGTYQKADGKWQEVDLYTMQNMAVEYPPVIVVNNPPKEDVLQYAITAQFRTLFKFVKNDYKIS